MDEATRILVRKRAGNRCEFCGLSQEAEPFFTFHIEHITARQHGGGDEPENLALACHHCNLQKGPNLSAVDPVSSEVVRLFHPRNEVWTEHFTRNGSVLDGLTPTGRATVTLLKMNATDRRRLR